MSKILALLTFVPRIAKAIIGGLAGSAIVPATATAIGNVPIWNFEYMLAAFFGVGITVYMIPNKP